MFSPLCFSITFDCKEVSDHTDDAVGLWEVFPPSILKTNWGVRVDQLKKSTELTNSVKYGNGGSQKTGERAGAAAAMSEAQAAQERWSPKFRSPR